MSIDLEKSPEKHCDLFSAFINEWISLILAGNQDNHKSFNEFEFGHTSVSTTAIDALEHFEKSP